MRYASASRGRQAITDEVIGKVGRVTGAVGPGRVGEIMLAIRGGSEHFHAYPVDAGARIPVGTRVVVVEYHPPRTVIVAEA